MSKQDFKSFIITFGDNRDPKEEMGKAVDKLIKLGLDAEFGVANVLVGTNMATFECTSNVENVLKQMENISGVSPNSLVSITPQPVVNGERIRPIFPKTNNNKR